MKRTICIFLLVIAALPAKTQSGLNPDPMADVRHYEFGISLSDTSNSISCTAVIEMNFRGRTSVIHLDLDNENQDGNGMKISTLLCDGKVPDWDHTANRINIRPAMNIDKDTTISILIKYSGIPADGLIISKNRYGNRTFFADHWPDRASSYLPVVDHPSDKATVDFVITAPEHYEVVASGYMAEESDLPLGMKLTRWKEDIPIPVKVMTFAAADFASCLAGKVNDIPVWTWVFPENREEGFYDYAVAVKPMKLYSELIGPYPYEKLANVQSKTIFGGLENAGCIFYYENSVTGQGKAEDLIAHEVAHQWFGNSVTEKDWHHIWLSEGFATYMSAVYSGINYGDDKLRESMKTDRERVLRSSERRARPVIDTTITNLMNLLSVNSYEKGSWVLHMLRWEVGDQNFWKGIRLYYERFRNGNALTDDLEKVMEEVSGKDLGKFFHQWLCVAGEPVLNIRLAASKKKGTSQVIIEQKQEYLFSFNIAVRLTDNGKTLDIVIPVNDRTTVADIKMPESAVMTVDPDVKLLFRRVDK